MREILFRGKCIENGEWVYGAYGSHTSLDAMIINKPYPASNGGLSAIGFWKVRPNTVGQYTGLNDRNGVMIFEGDIVSAHGYCGYVSMDTDYWEIHWNHDFNRELYVWKDSVEVVGNIYDSPELLGVKK